MDGRRVRREFDRQTDKFKPGRDTASFLVYPVHGQLIEAFAGMRLSRSTKRS